MIKQLTLDMVQQIKDQYPNIKSLNLSNNPIEVIENLELLTTLLSLNISHNKLTSMNGLNAAKNLETIDVSSNQISTCDGISKLTSLKTLNLSKNQISDLSQIEKLRQNVSLKELNLIGNPVTQIENYREQVLDILPDLKSLDGIPVLEKEKIQKAPLNLKRVEIEEAIGKFLIDKVAPKSKEIPFETIKTDLGSPLRRAPSDAPKPFPDFQSLLNNSKFGGKSEERHHKSVNYSIATSNKSPMVNLDDGKKNDESGLFTFIYDKNIDMSRAEPKDALKEIMNIQESYIQKRSHNIGAELLKHWRNKVFELLLDAKKSEILNNQKFRAMEKDRLRLVDELDNANYLRARTEQELDAYKYELQVKNNELRMMSGSLKDEEFEAIKSQIRDVVQRYSHNMEEQQQRLNDGLFTLQSYHKRLQILQKRIKTYAQL
jgi:hypothetical protein